MFTFLSQGGNFAWVLIAIVCVIIFLTVKKGIQLFILKDVNPLRLETGINAIFFWGGISALLGIFAHFSGVYQAMLAISRANDISPGIVAMGYAFSLVTIISGLFIFMISAIIWFFYRWRYKKIVSSQS